ncbi:hypothetical protein CV133_gene48 [Chlorobiaceae phage CV-1-33]|nr:hypothetical protein [Chlorobiaceae bacterium]QOE32055.1 hypothetical protein CV133_gene48 [Chlorobiaceae phage CV-1-33]
MPEFQEYPKMIWPNGPDGEYVIVNNQEEELEISGQPEEDINPKIPSNRRGKVLKDNG